MPPTTEGNNWVNVKPITHVISFKPTQRHEVSTGVTSISLCKDETETHSDSFKVSPPKVRGYRYLTSRGFSEVPHLCFARFWASPVCSVAHSCLALL